MNKLKLQQHQWVTFQLSCIVVCLESTDSNKQLFIYMNLHKVIEVLDETKPCTPDELLEDLKSNPPVGRTNAACSSVES